MNRWFHYEGLDTQGRAVRGVVEVPTFNEADTEVRRRGVQPVRIFEHDRVRVIERSLECFMMGWLSLMPVAGIFAAVRAIIIYQQARIEAGKEWNPARRYLIAGFALSWLGSLISIIIAGVAFVMVIKAMGNE